MLLLRLCAALAFILAVTTTTDRPGTALVWLLIAVILFLGSEYRHE